MGPRPMRGLVSARVRRSGYGNLVVWSCEGNRAGFPPSVPAAAAAPFLEMIEKAGGMRATFTFRIFSSVLVVFCVRDSPSLAGFCSPVTSFHRLASTTTEQLLGILS